MRMENFTVAAIMAAMLMTAGAGRAAAQPADAKAAAEQLFAQSRTLMEQGNHAAACPKLEASLELDPALGTLLNLAYCYEKLGRLASAWARYRELTTLAAHTGQTQREQFARERAATLEPRLPRLLIQVPTPARVADLAVTRDGTAVDSTLFGTPVYVDPGEHEVAASAPGYEPFSTKVSAVEAQQISIEIPMLTPLVAEKEQKREERPADLHGAARYTSPGEPASMARHPASGKTPHLTKGSGAPAVGRTRRILGLATGGVGLATLAGGLGLGWSAVSTWEDAFDRGLCERETRTCVPEGQALTDTARSRATVSSVLVGAGVGIVATGVVLYLTAPERDAERRAARLVPMAGPDALGFAIAGGF